MENEKKRDFFWETDLEDLEEMYRRRRASFNIPRVRRDPAHHEYSNHNDNRSDDRSDDHADSERPHSR